MSTLGLLFIGYLLGIFVVPYLLTWLGDEPFYIEDIPAEIASAFLWPLALLVFSFRRLRRRITEGYWR